MKKEIKILISSCLLGDNVKYSGGNNLNIELINLLEKYNVKLIKVCPECLGGLSTPRMPAEIKEEKVFRKDGSDVTENFIIGAKKTLDCAKNNKIDFAILKEKSPSCGSSFIYDGNFSGTLIKGSGITSKILIKENFKIFSEKNLEEIEKILKNF